jgi:hypothetical protein
VRVRGERRRAVEENVAVGRDVPVVGKRGGRVELARARWRKQGGRGKEEGGMRATMDGSVETVRRWGWRTGC